MAGPMSAEDFYDLRQGEWKSAIEMIIFCYVEDLKKRGVLF